ncbi:DUF6114 domain-containing protein [Corynebacterium appendicis]|uniref:DUF6114 domain-containing protein n=1 Tax=Corynebacterium appendicis TaxID=163202 RepID=UPI00254BDE69|nr:DUF6114 domain-containing protein [Corynebacterium appendicis]MDK8624882.1 DUF6114 domain-containing protein [Corynebacterium appendicis]
MPANERETRRSFGQWRKERPFGAGLLMILGGAVILTPAYLSFEVSNIQIQVSTISGVSTLLIGILLITCGVMTWSKGDSRILTGITAMILALVALPTSNFGGFLLGTLLALLGGAWALSWSPEEKPAKESLGKEPAAQPADPAHHDDTEDLGVYEDLDQEPQAEAVSVKDVETEPGTTKEGAWDRG